MRILALDGASAAGAGFGLLQQGPDGLLERTLHWEAGQGAAVRLPAIIAESLAATDDFGAPQLIAVLTGPGSFTGLRATLALAHGIAAGLNVPVVGVSVGEALAATLLSEPGVPFDLAWCVSQARRDRVFIETVDRTGTMAAPLGFALDALPDPEGSDPILAGDARDVAGAVLSRRGLRWRPGPLRPSAVAIAETALRRRDGALPPADAQPLYVDAPEARPVAPAAG